MLNEESFRCQKWAKTEFLSLASDGEKRSTLSFIARTPQEVIARTSCLARTRELDSRDKPVYLVAPFEPYYRLLVAVVGTPLRSQRPVFVLVDDGLASYLPPQVMKMTRARDRAGSVAKQPLGLIQTARTVMARVFEALVADRVPVERFCLFGLKAGRLVLGPYHEAYREALSHRERHLSMRPGRTGLILSQPFSEYGWISQKEEANAIREIAQALSARGVRPVLKPHPREKAKYQSLSAEGFTLIPANFPVEEILPSLRPACVVGFTSTALVVASLLYRIPAISLAIWMYNRFKDSLPQLASREFLRLTQNAVFSINGPDDLDKVL